MMSDMHIYESPCITVRLPYLWPDPKMATRRTRVHENAGKTKRSTNFVCFVSVLFVCKLDFTFVDICVFSPPVLDFLS